MGRHVVCLAADLPPGQVTIVDIERRSIGVFNVNGAYYALRNRCPHRGAPLCRGQITGLVTSRRPYHTGVERDGEMIRCPWHGWEFDITTGRTVFNPHRVYVKTYPVQLEAGGAAQQPEDDPAIETFPVRVEQNLVVLYTAKALLGRETGGKEAP